MQEKIYGSVSFPMVKGNKKNAVRKEYINKR